MLKAGPHVDGDLLTPPLPRSTLDVWQLGPSSDHMILLPVVNEGQLSNEPRAGGGKTERPMVLILLTWVRKFSDRSPADVSDIVTLSL